MVQPLVPGSVFYLHCNFIKPPKPKYLVLACADPKPLFFFINTVVPDFIRNNTRLYLTQVLIDHQSHPFLRYDSYIDCHELCAFSADHILAQIAVDPGCVRGVLSDAARAAVVRTVRSSPTLAQRKIEWIVAALS